MTLMPKDQSVTSVPVSSLACNDATVAAVMMLCNYCRVVAVEAYFCHAVAEMLVVHIYRARMKGLHVLAP